MNTSQSKIKRAKFDQVIKFGGQSKNLTNFESHGSKEEEKKLGIRSDQKLHVSRST